MDQEDLEFSRWESGGSGILHMLELPGVFQIGIRRIWSPCIPFGNWVMPGTPLVPIPALNSLWEGTWAGIPSRKSGSTSGTAAVEAGNWENSSWRDSNPGGFGGPGSRVALAELEFWDLISEGFSNLRNSMIPPATFQEWLHEEIPSLGQDLTAPRVGIGKIPRKFPRKMQNFQPFVPPLHPGRF